MLGPMGSEIMRIFRLLSPEAIDTYIKEKKEVSVIQASATGSEEILYENAPKDNSQSSAQDETEELEVSEQLETHRPVARKVIPLSEYRNEGVSEEFVSDSVEVSHKQVVNSSGLESVGILSASQIRDQERKRLEAESKKKDSTTVFLIKERQKLRASKQKMIEQTAYKLYQDSAAQEFYHPTDEDLLSEDETSDLKGILVNKKHY